MQAEDELARTVSPYAIRVFLDDFKHDHAATLLALVTPKPEELEVPEESETPDKSSTPEEPEKSNVPKGPEEAPRGKQGTSDGEGQTHVARKPVKTTRTIPVGKLAVPGYGKPSIADADDAQAYVDALKAAILEAIAAGDIVVS